MATTSQVFLGLTVDCARCHDHKLDPIPQKDYYRLLSFFRNINHYRNGGPTDERADLRRRPGPERRTPACSRSGSSKPTPCRPRSPRSKPRSESGSNKSRAGAGFQQADMDDLHYRFYRDTWDRLPDFNVLKPEEVGTLRRPFFDLLPRTRNEAFGFVFEGS